MSQLARPAQYLLRIDDLCPTVSAERWIRLRALMEEFGIRPILAVIPNNQDRGLDASPPDPGFWNRMLAMQSGGAAIALHGFHHQCHSRGKSLLALHNTSEFAGVPFDEQRRVIASGLAILRGHGLTPKLFVAPRHGFDRNTLRALSEEGMLFLSDGLARRPFERGGVTWIPQQLWSPVLRPKGLWTICLHPNSTGDAAIEILRAFLRSRASQFVSFDQVTSGLEAESLPLLERLYEVTVTARLGLRRAFKRR
ncbi:MAG TPA: DUF2334 domain-containing protein [Terracidiphilus sp.]